MKEEMLNSNLRSLEGIVNFIVAVCYFMVACVFLGAIVYGLYAASEYVYKNYIK